MAEKLVYNTNKSSLDAIREVKQYKEETEKKELLMKTKEFKMKK